jgi:basic membrane lipoprotein Med (substrate-binding protein (PBP1-ABC) superfamily)
MYRLEAREEYARALRAGQKEAKELLAAGRAPHPAVLDSILPPGMPETYEEVGVLEIPIHMIVGVKSAGRVRAFSASFLPLLPDDSEFAMKWVDLCAHHMGEEGIHDPILCYEYLGRFYVQEGNKRVSVLKFFGAARISAQVRRILPRPSDEPHVLAYYEFLDFFRDTGLYSVQYRKSGDYARLLAFLGKNPGQPWTEQEKRSFIGHFHRFREAFYAADGKKLPLLPEEALLLWQQIHSYEELGKLPPPELKKSVAALLPDLQAATDGQGVRVHTTPETESKSALTSLWKSLTADCVHVAFVHQRNPQISPWTKGHEEGRLYLEKALDKYVSARSYFGADSQQQAETLLEQAVAEGAQVIFTTTPQLSRITLKLALKYPKVRFLNCSVDQPYSSIRTYYGRIFEGKFITGAIAGTMAENDRIGYIGSSPIFGVPASINAFALGALMTNPRATIELRWSCMEGDPVRELIDSGIRVISNRDVPTAEQKYLDLCSYGTYFVNDDGVLTSLGSPYWNWGKLYEHVVRSILDGTWDKSKGKAVNYWWGMDSGVIDVKLAKNIPSGVAALAEMLRRGLQQRTVEPFRSVIRAQDGTLKNDGSRNFTAEELLHMDWLCHNIRGSIPSFDQIRPYARSIVQTLGIHRDQFPVNKEGLL